VHRCAISIGGLKVKCSVTDYKSPNNLSAHGGKGNTLKKRRQNLKTDIDSHGPRTIPITANFPNPLILFDEFTNFSIYIAFKKKTYFSYRINT
jgi:hypothetical protein